MGNPGTGKTEDDIVFKLLSEDPSHYKDAPLEGIRRILEHFSGEKISRDAPLDTSDIEYIRMGTTVATNALLERKGERCALITSKGFKDCLVIGNQTRPHIFDLSITKPEVLYETVVEINERVTLEDYTEDPSQTFTKAEGEDLVKGLSGETIRVLKKPHKEEVEKQLQDLYNQGIRSIGVCFLHSYTYPDHEKFVGDIARQIGFSHVSLSSEVSPMIKFIPRANSCVADAYLTPETKRYLSGFTSGLRDGTASPCDPDSKGARCQFMQSDGGLVDANYFSGLKAILSGPAGGVVGYSRTCYNSDTNIPLIGFDMGGTSTDVSRFGDGKLDHVFETTTAGVTIQSPQLDINTVAAGGGSMLFFKNGLFQVGPESAGSQPGPACYKKGGPLTVTDANLFLGRLLPEYFPKIFGPDENDFLDEKTTREKFLQLTHQINSTSNTEMTADQVAYGFIEVANETMARPIRSLTEAKGHVTSNHRLVSFGGAGGQHAAAVAASLGVKTILIHRYSSVLSAYGMALADVVEDVQEPSSLVLDDSNRPILEDRIRALTGQAVSSLKAQGFQDEDIAWEEYLNMRYKGTESGIMVTRNKELPSFETNFLNQHKREFGFLLEKTCLLVDDVRVRAIGKASRLDEPSIDQQMKALSPMPVSPTQASMTKSVFFESCRTETPVYRLESLEIGTQITGPAIIADGTQTNIVPPLADALVLRNHIVVTLGGRTTKHKESVNSVDPVLLSIFSHRLMDIADQMGVQLQKTSLSTNVKERLDFSCALFDLDGKLVANAPHVPVHLGSMGYAVEYQAKLWRGKLHPGDVLVTNHPCCGGTHLPDITVIMPVFHEHDYKDPESVASPIFWLAARSHHADIGGSTPGSMSSKSHVLQEEGVAIFSEFLVKRGKFQIERLETLFLEEPAKFKGCSGARRFSDNVSDLKAQLAANQKGMHLLSQLVREFGLDTVWKYMKAIQTNSAEAVRKMLRDTVKGDSRIECTDYMDDGSQIQLCVKIDRKGDAVFDFEGTSPQVYGNINAPEAITYSAILYCLRCLINESIPLNQGCLEPIQVKLPKNSLLSPGDGCAVVGGNVLTSQRVTDVVMKAFKVMADSQGCCNNLTFGIEPENGLQGWGYYETIGGGAGAGQLGSKKWNGASGVHTHMTNTRMTDTEVLEKRYPVILNRYSLRENSGGEGYLRGGDGVIRDLVFKIPMVVSVLSERRVTRPNGLFGGSAAKPGLNLWVRKTYDNEGNELEDRVFNVGGKNSVPVAAGDRMIIETPGGGGYGLKTDKSAVTENSLHPSHSFRGTGSVAQRLDAQYTN